MVREITLDRHGMFSFKYLKMIGKRGKGCVQTLIVFLIFCIFRSQGETEAGDNKFANGSVLNDSVKWLPNPLNSLPFPSTKVKDPLSEPSISVPLT